MQEIIVQTKLFAFVIHSIHMDLFIANLEKALQETLPGEEAQYKMAHTIRRGYALPTKVTKTACVLALLYPKNEEWHIVLIQRMSNNKNDKHSPT